MSTVDQFSYTLWSIFVILELDNPQDIPPNVTFCTQQKKEVIGV